jgi:hypothetical protein
MPVDRARAKVLAKLYTDDTTDGGGSGSVDPGFFASQGSLNAPPNVHGGLSAPSGSYQKGWIKTGEPGWDAIQDAHQGIAPTIPNALPPPSAGTTAGPGTTIS